MSNTNSQYSHKVQCNICPRRCNLSEGQRGFCFVRQNIGGKIVLTTYGYNTGLAIDPIEKKPLYHFLPGSKVLSFGTTGCNLGCAFCQNWESSRAKIDPKLLNPTSPKQIAQAALKNDCKSVAFTYNEPIVFYEYALDTAKEARTLGLKTVAVSAGYIEPEPRIEFFKWMDAANIDLKSFNPDFYKRNCLVNIEPILDTIKYIKNETECWLELTTLIIEGENDNPKEIEKECKWILDNLGSDVPLHFSAFHPAYKFMHKKSTKHQTVLDTYRIAKSMGIKHVYTGNIIDSTTSTTYCSNCKNPIIERDGYSITEYNLDEDANCEFCGYKCEGVF